MALVGSAGAGTEAGPRRSSRWTKPSRVARKLRLSGSRRHVRSMVTVNAAIDTRAMAFRVRPPWRKTKVSKVPITSPSHGDCASDPLGV